MAYPQYFIEDLKNRADLVRIIQPYAQDLKKKGANWMACCPFHDEKTPSFSVNPSKGFYKCFGCGKGGTAFNFIMEMEGVNFPEAVRRVAEISGVMLPESEDDETFRRNKIKYEEKKQLAERVIELNELALEFWENELQNDTPKAKAAREYLIGRGIDEETQKRFRLGFSADSWDSLLNALRDFGAEETLIVQSGLVSVNEEKDRIYDRFRGRIMFPVLDIEGRPVAFGARGMTPEDQPKYLNSPETPAYIKGNHLYGLFQAKDEIRKRQFAILVEGYLDLIALAQFGINNAAASLGTAFTDDQAKLLGRFTKRVVINYDGDKAGISAARRAIEHLLPQDFDVKVLVLPDGQDPDDFVRQNGTESYNQARGTADTFLAFTLKNAISGKNLNNARQKAEAIESIAPVIAAIRNNIQRRESFNQAMEYFRIDDPSLKNDIWRSIAGLRTADSYTVAKSISRSVRPKITVSERLLLELLMHDPPLRELIVPQIETSDYDELATAEIYSIITSGSSLEIENFVEHLGDDEELLDTLRQILQTKPRREADEAIDEVMIEAENCVISLRKMAIERRISDISREAALAAQEGDSARSQELALQQFELEKIARQMRQNPASI